MGLLIFIRIKQSLLLTYAAPGTIMLLRTFFFQNYNRNSWACSPAAIRFQRSTNLLKLVTLPTSIHEQMKVAMQSFFFFPMLYAVGLCKLVCVALVPAAAAAAAAARTNLKKDKKHN